MSLLFRYVFVCLSLLYSIGHVNAQLVINEVCPINGNGKVDEDGDHKDWVEVYNNTAQPINLLNYGLSDNDAKPSKWKFPAVIISPNSFLLIFLSGKNKITNPLHASFKAGSDEFLSLYNSSMEVIDRIGMHDVQLNHSIGRFPDGSNSIQIFNTITPNLPNMEGYNGYVSPIIFSTPSAINPTVTTLLLNCATAGATIYYTTNGDEPDSSSIIYNNSIALSGNMVVKARGFLANKLPSAIITNTYIFNLNNSRLPIMHISIADVDLYSDSSGILVHGSNYNPADPKSANYWQDWEKKAHLQVFSAQGNLLLTQDFGLKIHGGSINRLQAMKSFRLLAKGKYGKSKFKYSFIPTKPIKNYKKIVLRNSSSDFNRTQFRDGILQRLLLDKTEVECLGYQPCLVYVNGLFYGIEDIREKISPWYFEENHPEVNHDLIDMIEDDTIVHNGTYQQFDLMANFITQHNMAISSNYIEASKMIEIASYCDYYISQTYWDNNDWPYNNMRCWRENKEGQKWRWVLFDMDASLGGFPWSPYTLDWLGFILGEGGNASKQVSILKSLLNNPSFKNYFINRYADLMNTAFTPFTVKKYITMAENTLAEAMPQHKQKWGGTLTDWHNEIDDLTIPYIENRPAYAREQLNTAFGLQGQVNTVFEVFPPYSGTIKLNTLMLDTFPFSGIYYNGNEIKFTAVANYGFNFVHWINEEGAIISTAEAVKNIQTNTTITALFSDGNDDKIIVAPNPSDGNFLISYYSETTNQASFEITNSNGEVILRQINYNSIAGNNYIEIDLSNFSAGIYFIKITNVGKVLRDKLIVR